MSAFTRDEAHYDALILERLAALRARPSYRSARRRCLGLMGRREAFASLDDWADADHELQADDPSAWWEVRHIADPWKLFAALGLILLVLPPWAWYSKQTLRRLKKQPTALSSGSPMPCLPLSWVGSLG